MQMKIVGNVQRNSLRLDLNYFRGEVFVVSTSSRVDLSEVSYSLYPELDQNYVTGGITTELSGYVRNKWLVDAKLYSRIYDRDFVGTSHNIGLLDMSLSRFLFGGRGNLRLQVHDLLNHNQGVIFSNGATYIQEAHTESIGRYLLLKFTYKPRLL